MYAGETAFHLLTKQRFRKTLLKSLFGSMSRRMLQTYSWFKGWVVAAKMTNPWSTEYIVVEIFAQS